ncbi:hypothetical protein INR49_018819 [Caranx melampygus]|nr:hypothetical protein INR49_018819 [Caranx melampygus]
MPWLSKQPVLPLTTDNTKCDKSMSCPGKSTCCKTASGGWACCPLTQAVCCDDHVHCCPHGTVCNLEAQTCDDPSGALLSLPWVEKVTALTSQDEDEKCDKETMCPGGTTCCKKNSGQWACCPLPQAVCCSDHEHCCPKGYKCNVAEQTCDKPEHLSAPGCRRSRPCRRTPAPSPSPAWFGPTGTCATPRPAAPRTRPAASWTGPTNGAAALCPRPSAVKMETTAAPVDTPASLTAPPAPGARTSSPGSPK